MTQAVLIAKQMPGTPIKLLWSREEDMTQGAYHPITMCKMVGALDEDNNLVGLQMRISGQSILAGIAPVGSSRERIRQHSRVQPAERRAIGYSIPNILIDHAMRNPHITPGFWRGVNNNQNAIYLECFIDEVAHAAGQDPLEFRRKMMEKHPKNLAVLNAVAEKAGWGTPPPAGRVPRHRQHDGIRQLCRRRRRSVGLQRWLAHDPSHRRRTDPGHVANPAQSSGRSPDRSCTGCRPRSTADSR